MIDEVSDTLSQVRTHTMKGLKGEVSLGKKTRSEASSRSVLWQKKAAIVEI
jgi:hypothetical protein